MNNEKTDLIHHAVEDAHQQAKEFASCVVESFDGNPDERDSFMEAISTLYDMMDDDQFLSMLDILFEVFDIDEQPSQAVYASNELCAYAHNTMFLQHLALCIICFDGESE